SSLIDAGVLTQVVRYPSVSHAALADHPPALQEAERFFQWRFDARAHR
ncbi:alpha/beta hydrolase, partial [Pseudomonas sp. FW301-21B01]